MISTRRKIAVIGRSSPVFRLFVFVFLCFEAEFAWSLPVEDLYMAEVLVVSEEERQLVRGARAGLLQVLVRVSGGREVENSSLIAASLRKPEVYYYQYSYESTDKTLQIGDEVVPAQLLRIHFEPSAVAKLLRRAGFPVWGSNRPGVLLWIALSDDDGRRILSGDEVSEITKTLQDQARLRGLPLLFPLLDLEDSASLSTAEVWGAFLGRIADASGRYNLDCILTGRIQKDSVGRWNANWSYQIDKEWRVTDSVTFAEDKMIRSIVDRLANELAERYAIDSSHSHVTIRIESIDNLEEYSSVSNYLESLGPVLDSSVVQVEGDEIEFKLDTEGQNEQLIELIQLDEKMVLLSADEEMELLHYRWVN
ncbi:MAG: hypothetical protein CMQ19_07415 [Gammaproteobacteria bacterium]|nr:hypothetical protein [Gammaproteobacteria bacterium]